MKARVKVRVTFLDRYCESEGEGDTFEGTFAQARENCVWLSNRQAVAGSFRCLDLFPPTARNLTRRFALCATVGVFDLNLS